MDTEEIPEEVMYKIEEVVVKTSTFLRDRLSDEGLRDLTYAFVAVILLFKRNMTAFNMLAEGEGDLLKDACKMLMEDYED